MEDEDYYDALPMSGLILAQEQAEQYLAQADDAYPSKDVTMDLLLIESELEAREAVKHE